MSNIEIHVSCSNGPSYSLQALGAQWEYCTISQGFCLCALFLPKYYLVVSLLDRINLIIHHLYLLLICIHIYNFFIIFLWGDSTLAPHRRKKKPDKWNIEVSWSTECMLFAVRQQINIWCMSVFQLYAWKICLNTEKRTMFSSFSVEFCTTIRQRRNIHYHKNLMETRKHVFFYI